MFDDRSQALKSFMRSKERSDADDVEENPVALEEGMRFAIREGGRTIGAGTVSKILK